MNTKTDVINKIKSLEKELTHLDLNILEDYNKFIKIQAVLDMLTEFLDMVV